MIGACLPACRVALCLCRGVCLVAVVLQGRMKTASGARLAQARHDYMEGFVKQFLQEWDCADAEAA